jgi:hypothetical protein
VKKKERHRLKQKAREIVAWCRGRREIVSREDLEYELGLNREQADGVYRYIVDGEKTPVTHTWVIDKDDYGDLIVDRDVSPPAPSCERIEEILKEKS